MATTTPATELAQRIADLQQRMQDVGVGGSLIVQKTDLFYYSGTSQQGWLYVPEQGEPVLMVFKEVERALQESALNRQVSLVSNKKIPEVLTDYGYPLPAKLGMELDVLPVNLFRQYEQIFTDSQIVDISLQIRLQRAVKSAYEIGKIREAASLSDQLAAKVPEFLVPGKTEVTLAGEMEGYARSLGHQGIVRMRSWGSELFYGHLMSGPEAAVPSYLLSPTGGKGVSGFVGQGAGYKKIARNEPVLFDYVFALDGYLSDHTRIFCIGDLPDQLKQAHEAALEIQASVKGQARPGVVCGELYQRMLTSAEAKGIADGFMGHGERKIRFTGHGIGLELDEFPFIAMGQKVVLEEGMVIALEPKVIMPGLGVVGIENTHLVTDKGLEALTVFADAIHYIAD